MKNKILETIEKYKEVVHTQDKDLFYSIFLNDMNTTLISINKEFIGLDSIYDDFLIDTIQKPYSEIELVIEKTDVHILSENCSIVTLTYHTVCTKRDGTPYGIAGYETQVLVKQNGTWKIAHVHYSK